MLVPFLKMNGLGNDFVFVDERLQPREWHAETVRWLADRQAGPGFDQFILVGKGEDGVDATMSIRNADGSTAMACGNAARCLGRLLMAERHVNYVMISAPTHLISAQKVESSATQIRVDMGAPKFEWQDIPLNEAFSDTRRIELQVGPIDDPVLHSPSVANIGNPHVVFFVDALDRFDVTKTGPLLEHHPRFPEGVNVSLAQITDDANIVARVWERGAGATLACGSAACAIVACAVRLGHTRRQVQVSLPGGTVWVDWRHQDNHVYLTGETEFEYAGMADCDARIWHKTSSQFTALSGH